MCKPGYISLGCVCVCGLTSQVVHVLCVGRVFRNAVLSTARGLSLNGGEYTCH